MKSVQLTLVGMLKKYGPPQSTVTVEPGRTVREEIEDLGLDPDLVAVIMVNGRQRYKSYRLQAGDRVKLVPMVGGG
jgi:sulfur carrier protein ThiS